MPFYAEEVADYGVIYRKAPLMNTVHVSPGIYEVKSDLDGPFLRHYRGYIEDYVVYGDHFARLQSELSRFLSPDYRQKIAAHGLKNKRGAILYGPPGTGKSATVFYLMQQSVAKHGCVCIIPNTVADLKTVMPNLRCNSDVPVILFWDEFDRYCRREGERMATWLDSPESFDNVFNVGATNHIQEIPDKILRRPSRISCHIRVPYPPKEDKLFYLRAKFPEIDGESIEAIAVLTENLSLDFAKEMAIQYAVYGVPLNQLESVIKANMIEDEENGFSDDPAYDDYD